MIKEYIISGHSDKTIETFIIPYNLSIIFYANLDETCFVPHNKESLDLVVNSMKYGQFEIYRQGEVIQNYHITFNKKEFEGVATINNQNINNNSLDYDFFDIPENINSLKDICNFIQRKNNRSNSIIYCIFCRGSKMEFEEQDFGDFNEQDIDKYLNEEYIGDFIDLLSDASNNSIGGNIIFKTSKKIKQKQSKKIKKYKRIKQSKKYISKKKLI